MNYRALLLAVLLLFLPVRPVLIVVMVLTVVDLICGVWAAAKRGEAITSSGLKRTVVKILVYESVVLLAYLTEQYLTGDIFPIVKILSGYIGITELKSCMENMESITGAPILKALINQIVKVQDGSNSSDTDSNQPH
jgi:phage-related holin